MAEDRNRSKQSKPITYLMLVRRKHKFIMNPLAVLLVLVTTFALASGVQENVFGNSLSTCSRNPLTGWYRDGKCRTDWRDSGTHVVCAKMTDAFLKFSKERGNDLITPSKRYRFPGLKEGDYWCLCAFRWKEALKPGLAPYINSHATNKKALEYIPLATLTAHDVSRKRYKN